MGVLLNKVSLYTSEARIARDGFPSVEHIDYYEIDINCATYRDMEEGQPEEVRS